MDKDDQILRRSSVGSLAKHVNVDVNVDSGVEGIVDVALWGRKMNVGEEVVNACLLSRMFWLCRNDQYVLYCTNRTGGLMLIRFLFRANAKVHPSQ